MAWTDDLLSALGAPASANNTAKLQAWNACEGNESGGSGLPINNPFNTTMPGYGGVSVNSAGVKQYPSWSAGVAATIATLASPRYAAIVANLKGDGPGGTFAGAVGSSGWGTNGGCIASRLGSGAASGATPGGTLTAAAPQQGATPAAPASQTGPFSPQDQARMVYMGTLATYGPEILDPSSPTFTEWNAQGGNATLTSKGSSIWGDMWNGFFGAVFPGATIAGGSGGIGGVIGGAETAAGVFAWLMKPTNLLRLAEIVAGAGILAVGGAMYIQILVPSVGGVIGVLAGGPGGTAARLGSNAIRTAGQTRQLRIREEAATQRHQETESQRSYRASQGRTTSRGGPGRHTRIQGLSSNRPGRITHSGGKSYNEAGEELFA